MVKLIGSWKYTFTSLPFCLPGFQAGIDLITLIASLSHSGQPGTPFNTSTIDILPSSFTTNLKKHFPLIPASLADGG